MPAKHGRNPKESMAKKTSKSAAKSAKTVKVAKITAASKPRSRGEFYTTIAEQTQLSRKQVASVFETMGKILSVDLGKSGPGICNVAGLMKVTVVRKPATKARKGINPFTKQEVMFKAKPARNVIKVRPLKTLKSMV
ncbi:MAG: HU family DNA-binding protein [Planctomycetes bacterium]|nr:HU family DNA-binding protein [Planctomycetota bacterium]